MTYGVHPSTIAQIYDGIGLASGEPFPPPVPAGPYGHPYVTQPYGGFGSPGGNNDQSAGFPTTHMGHGGAGYTYAQLPGGQFYPMLPGHYVFPQVNEASSNGSHDTAAGNGQPTETSS